MNYHVGEWISVRAQAERTPPRFTLTVTLGELPEGWSRTGNRARTWSGIVGLLLIAPFVALLVASALHNLGVGTPYSWLAGSSVTIVAGTSASSSAFPWRSR
ncbi:MAG TPA: hypothetical protein VGA47_06240 [Candidatus Dormibacteraeota bacterium]